MQKPVVLCVEPEPVVRDTSRLILEGAGYQVLTARTAAEALEILARQRVDAAMVEYILPDMTGPQLARRIKGRFPGLPLLLTACFANDETEVHPADRFLLKPCEPELLLATLADLLYEAWAREPERIAA